MHAFEYMAACMPCRMCAYLNNICWASMSTTSLSGSMSMYLHVRNNKKNNNKEKTKRAYNNKNNNGKHYYNIDEK